MDADLEPSAPPGWLIQDESYELVEAETGVLDSSAGDPDNRLANDAAAVLDV